MTVRERYLAIVVLGFIVLVIVGSMGLIPRVVTPVLNDVARACLVVAIAGVGLKTSPLELKKVGLRAFALLAAETVFLALMVLGEQRLA